MNRSFWIAGFSGLLFACGGNERPEILSSRTQAAVSEAFPAKAAEPASDAPPTLFSADKSSPSQPRALPGQGIGETVTDTGAQTIAPSMVIRSGHASVEVRSVDSAIVQVNQIAQRLGGYIAGSSVEGGQHSVRSATLEIKVPAARFDDVLTGLEPLGTVESVNITSQDVSEEFVDVSARMTNARRLEGRLLALLTTRAGKLEDVLAVERELARVRGEIERLEGRLRYLKTRVAVSTLIVVVHERTPVINSLAGNPVAEAFKQAWRNFVAFIAAFIESLGILIPLAILAAGVWFGIRRYRRQRGAKSEVEKSVDNSSRSADGG